MAKKKKRYRLNPVFKKAVVLATIILALSFITVFCLVNSVKKFNTLFNLMAEVNDAKAQLAALQAENDYLTNQKEKLTDSDYVSSWARGKYNLTKKGENVFQLPSNNEN